jgi:hypothetical protein
VCPIRRSFLANARIPDSIRGGASVVPPKSEEEEAVAERGFNEDALRRAEVRLSKAEAELMARSLRWALRRDLAAAHGRGEEGPSPITLRTVEAAAAALAGATLLEAAKRSEAAWTGDAERDGRRAAEDERRAEEGALRKLGEERVAGIERMELLGRAIEGVKEGRKEFSAEEVGLMRAVLGLGRPSSADRVEGFLDEGGGFGKHN